MNQQAHLFYNEIEALVSPLEEKGLGDIFYSYLIIFLLFSGFASILWSFSVPVTKIKTTEHASTSPEVPRDYIEINQAHRDIQAHMTALDPRYISDVKIQKHSDHVVLSMSVSKLFPPGDAIPGHEQLKELRRLGQVIMETAYATDLVISGYTDSIRVKKSNDVFPSNWELSAARAGTLVRTLESLGFPKERMKIEAYGATRHTYDEFDNKGRFVYEQAVKNRRLMVSFVRRDIATQKGN